MAHAAGPEADFVDVRIVFRASIGGGDSPAA
jgi:hypothetical protein